MISKKSNIHLQNIFGRDRFSQHIRIGLLLFLLYCNRLGEYEKAQKIEKTITWQIQQEISNCEELQKEIRIVERLSPALYSNEVAYRKTKRSLDYFENKSLFMAKNTLCHLLIFWVLECMLLEQQQI